MGFGEAIKHVFNNYANFSGRARRSEYWYWTLFNIIVSAVLGGISGGVTSAMSLGGLDSESLTSSLMSSSLSTIWALAVLIPSFAVCVRRLHDIGKSGWSYLIGLVPVVGWIVLIVWFLKDSNQGPNQYGDSPKYPSYQAGFNSAQNPYQQYQQPTQGGGYYAPQQPQQPTQGGYYTPQYQQQPPYNNDQNWPKQ